MSVRKCKDCAEKFSSDSGLRSHRMEFHDSLFARFKCVFECDSDPFTVPQRLRDHYLATHSSATCQEYIRVLYINNGTDKLDYLNCMCFFICLFSSLIMFFVFSVVLS